MKKITRLGGNVKKKSITKLADFVNESMKIKPAMLCDWNILQYAGGYAAFAASFG